jgi:uncharacterized protein YbjT (DUF2867 family)
MKLTIVAATGGVGRELPEQAVAAGHDVTVVVRNPAGLDWTVIRPPRLTSKPLTGTYRTAYGQNLRGGLSVPRADVAHLMLHILGQPDTIHQAIGIAS